MVYCLHQPFKTIGKLFKVFAEETTDILVPYGDGKYWIDQLRSLENNFFDIGKYYDVIEQAKPYTVKIYDWQKNLLDQAGLLYPFADGRILTLDEKAYDDHFGLKVVKEQPVEDFIL